VQNISVKSINPETRNSKSVKSNKSSGGSRANDIQCHDFQSKSTNAVMHTGNELAAAVETGIPYEQPSNR
jgi:hypothetical protein